MIAWLLAAQIASDGEVMLGDVQFNDTEIEALLRTLGTLPPPEAVGQGQPLDLNEVLATIDDRHPLLRAAREKRRGAAGGVMNAQGGFDPELSLEARTQQGYYENERAIASIKQATPLWGLELSGGYSWGRGDFAAYDGAPETLPGGEAYLGLRVPLWRNGPIDPRRAKLATAQAELVAENARLVSKQLELQSKAALGYWKWVAAGQGYRVALHLYQLAEARDAQLATKVSQGALPSFERAENLRSLLLRRQDLIKARRELENAALGLSLYWRGPDGQPQQPQAARVPPPLAEPLPAPATELELALDRLQHRPELAALTAQVQAAQVDVRLTSNQVAPDVALNASANRNFGAVAPQDQRLAGTEWKAGVTLTLPLLLRAQRGSATKAEAKLDELRAQTRWLKEQLQTEVLDLWSATRAAQEQATVAAKGAEVAEAVAAGERARFELGMSSLLLVNLREQAAADAELRAVRTFAEHALAWFQFRVAACDPTLNICQQP